MRTSLLLSVLALMIAAPTALIACSGEEKEATTSASQDEINRGRPTNDGEGDYCWQNSDCADGLLCKERPSGPPPGAVGLPLPEDHKEEGKPAGMPPGAVGLPLPPNTCQRPAPGEEGSSCLDTKECNDGLTCEFNTGSSSSGGPPPGAVGLPVPADEGPHFPPGAMGMPILRRGKCAVPPSGSSTGGMPPGAVGLPIMP